MKKITLFLLFPIYLVAQWNPNAGVVPSFTNNAVVTASSGININTILDGDDDTNWVSSAPVPIDFIARRDQNLFLTSNFDFNCSNCTSLDETKMTDGNLISGTTVTKHPTTTYLALQFDSITTLKWLSLKLAADSAIAVYAFTTSLDSFLITTHTASNNYKFLRHELGQTQIKQLKFISKSSFMVYEIAGLANNPKEFVTIDLGAIQPVGKIYLRHWCGVLNGLPNAEKVELQVSADAQQWEVVANLKPDALPTLVTDLEEERQVRYLRVEYTLRVVDYLKVFCWEMDAYNRNGKYGETPPAQPSQVTISELLGISGIWGWGNNKYSDLLPSGQGPDLYAPVFSHARNYHNMSWDVFDPDHRTDFKTMSKGLGTEVFPWLNWDREYRRWQNAGLKVQVSIQFDGFRDTLWNTPETSAYYYGFDFARHFGFSNGVRLIPFIEVGNEPWNYDSTTYQQILHGMATGAKAADPTIKVIPCALQATDPEAEFANAPFNNYVGNRIAPKTLPYLDGLNAHIYSYDNRPDGMRYATYPEHINSSMREIINLIRFRDANMPGKPIYCTEWGWDHPSDRTESCTHDECVSEEAAAAYAVRGALFLMRLGVHSAIWYFYGDTKTTSSLYTRSGVTGSVRNQFAKKRSYYALQTLVNQVGNKRFLGTLQENDTAWVYVFGDTLLQPTHLVAWRPVEGDSLAMKEVKVTGNYIPLSAIKIDGKNDKGTPTALPKYQPGSLVIPVNSIPTLIEIDTCENCPEAIVVSVKTFLQGAYQPASQLMSNNLNLLKMLTSDSVQVDTDALGLRKVLPSVFEEVGNTGITDWIRVELWNETQHLATRTGFLLRDGNIVDVDGSSSLTFYGFSAGNYHLVVRHRNHLPIKTQQMVGLTGW